MDEKQSQLHTGTPANPYERVQSAIATLRSQHATLSGLIPFADSNLSVVHESPLPTTVVEQAEGSYTGVRFGSPIARKTWMSTATSLSDGGSIWFDAVDEHDGAEELSLDIPHEVSPGDGQTTVLGGQDNSHTFEEESDTDEEEEAARLSLALSERGVVAGAQQVAHRTSLPCGPVADEGSLFAVFRKNVGKVRPTHYGFAVLCAEPSMKGSCQRGVPCDIQ